MSPFDRLVAGVRRRTLWQVLGLYAAGAWVALQVVDIFANNFSLPASFPAVALVLIILGLPVVVATYFVQRRVQRTVAEGAAGPGGGGAPGTAETAARRWLTWHNAVTAGVVAFAAWGVVAAAWFVAQGGAPGVHGGPPDDGAIPVSPTVVAVFPFAVRGDPDFAYLGAGMVNLLGTKLDGAGELRSVDSRALLSAIEGGAGEIRDPSRASRVASDFGAGLFVMGDLIEVGGRFRITAALYRSSDGTTAVADASVEGDNAFELVDEMATELLAGVEGGPGARVRRIAAVTTTSLEAFRAYLNGEAEFRAGRFGEALEAFQKAVALDSLYAMAYYRMSVAAEWLTRPDIEVAAAEQAYRHGTRLSERDRRMLEAFLAWRRGAHGEAERGYRAIVSTYPTDVEAWFQLGEVLFHANPMHGRSIAESREPFERVLHFQDDAAAIIHLVRLASLEGDLAAVDSLLPRFFALGRAGERTYEMRALEVFTRDVPHRQDSLLSEVATRSDLNIMHVVWNAAIFAPTDRMAGSERAARMLTDESRFPADVRATGHSVVAFLLLARGRLTEALGELDALAAFDPTTAAELRAIAALLPYATTDRETLLALRTDLANLDPARAPYSGNPSFFFNSADEVHEVFRLYLVGMLSARLGDATAALEHAAALDTLSVPPKAGSLASDLAASIRAGVAVADGRPADALASLEDVRAEILYSWCMASPFFGEIIERYARGRALQDLGRHEEALGWYAHLGEMTVYALALAPPAHLRQAEIYEALGRPSEAARHYAAFADLWRDADPGLQPLVDEAREAVRRLMPDGAES